MTKPPSPIRVLIADDNRAYRRGVRVRLSQTPGIRVIGEVSTGIDAVTVARAEHVHVVLMDLQMPGGTGIDATRELIGSGTPVAVVVVTAHAADRFLIDALDAGAIGFLPKSHDTRELVAAVRAAASGEGFVSSTVTRSLLAEFARRRRHETDAATPTSLTPAELDVVQRLSAGMTTNEEIAADLLVSINTVRTHIRSALSKTGTRDRTALALWGLRNGLDRRSSHPHG